MIHKIYRFHTLSFHEVQGMNDTAVASVP